MHASLKELFLLWVFVQLEIKLTHVLLFLMEERETVRYSMASRFD